MYNENRSEKRHNMLRLVNPEPLAWYDLLPVSGQRRYQNDEFITMAFLKGPELPFSWMPFNVRSQPFAQFAEAQEIFYSFSIRIRVFLQVPRYFVCDFRW